MIVDLITAQNMHAKQDLLREMFRQRHRVFVERLGWDVPSINGEEERDEFDRPDTAYLVVSEPSGRVIGSWRLLSTEQPYMASTVFRHLFDGAEPPRAPDIWEISRFVVEPSGQGTTRAGIDHATGFLFAALFECAFTYGVRELVTVEDIAVARLAKKVLETKPLWHGPVCALGNTRAIVARYPVNGQIVQTLRDKFVTRLPIVQQFALWQPPLAEAA
ncbi:acyl-homoserine-lactone synthase [Magnetospirillum sp. UT-4]|uniref:acyl-homoserine-lactone synthase n=1 Tax=Magnetospirillum sp. UT-4 TaxID=2681467 RepID=UPI00137D5A73|nr:acyl-homoserine-lactone synthase [Magnetospirillum sp. UT-4]CAA7625720.1 Autoinducer synthesis protein solI (modular protein) [Magnetospirillum sp. UT-4]